MAEEAARVRLKIQFGGTSVGPGKIALLEAVAREGSISAAGRSMGMAYRRAWHLLRTLQDALEAPLLVTETGGRDKGGASLTPFAETLIRHYRAAEIAANRDAAELMDYLARNRKPGNPEPGPK